jgi:glycosyltransferase involved in cell wall biosynthesis
LKKAYLYPISGRNQNLGLYNPYIDDFINSLSEEIKFLNQDHPSKIGFFNVIQYLFKIDFLFLNWIEDVPDLKGGKLQIILLRLIVLFKKILGIKIVWTMHNKLSHTKDNFKLKRKVFLFLLKRADYILTHSSAGIRFSKEMLPGLNRKIHYLPHPVKDRRLKVSKKKTQDILIWGTISPYKGIDKFLEFLHNQNLENKYKIFIVGKITSREYATTLEKFTSKNIEIKNSFIEDELLKEYISQSHIVLFTYSQDSILSSGVLMDSLGFGASIIGPEVGAFEDLEQLGIVQTFKKFDEIPSILDNQIKGGESENKTALDQFLIENSWNRFAKNLMKILLV